MIPRGCMAFFIMQSGLNIVSLWFGVIMVTLVVSGAVAITFTDFMSDRLYGTKRVVFVFILLGYAVYRSFRIYQVYQQNKNER